MIHVKGTHNSWLSQFYSLSVSYMTLTIDKADGCALCNRLHHECLANEMKLTFTSHRSKLY